MQSKILSLTIHIYRYSEVPYTPKGLVLTYERSK
jgi:hypothetical protein